MDWEKRIVAEPSILAGKPIIKGTRLSVEFVLGLLAAGWTTAQLQENYPQLSTEDLQAVFAFTRMCLEQEEFVVLKKAS